MMHEIYVQSFAGGCPLVATNFYMDLYGHPSHIRNPNIMGIWIPMKKNADHPKTTMGKQTT